MGLRKRKKDTSYNHEVEWGALEAIPNPVFVLETDGTTAYYNTPARSLLGLSSGEHFRGSFSDLFSTPSKRKLDDLWSLLPQNSSSLTESDMFLRRRSGRKIEVTVTLQKAYRSDETFVVVSLFDMSEIRRLQKQSEKHQKDLYKMSKLADLGKLSAGVAHEMNNPLMIIRGYAESIQMDVQQNTLNVESISRNLQRIIQATDRMNKITSNMMRLAREDEVHYKTLDLLEVTQENLTLLQNSTSDAQVEISLISETKDRIVSCDSNSISQVIINIISNAIHALSHVGSPRKIELRIRDCKDSLSKVSLGIWNNGPIIPPRVLENILVPFFSTKPVGEGVGLGLAISHEIMVQHGGNLTVTSEEGKGTEFTLSFPRVSIDHDLGKDTPLSVLIVDDEPFITELLEERILDMGHSVKTFNHPLKALEASKGNSFDLAFIDLRMPEMDGWELIRNLTSDSNISSIYAISAFPASAHKLESNQSLIAGVLQKPFDLSELIAVINRACLKVRSHPN